MPQDDPNHISTDDTSRRRRALERALAAATLIAATVVLLLISDRLTRQAHPSVYLIAATAAIGFAAGGAYCIALWTLRHAAAGPHILIAVITLGAAMRAILFPSAPILEDDFHRYLWDGAVLAQGRDPYRHAPLDVIAQHPELLQTVRRIDPEVNEHLHNIAPVPPGLAALSPEARRTVRHTNHKHLRTIYPPVAQATFVLAHWIKPFDISALRAVWLAFDIAALLLLIWLLRIVGRSPAWAAVYWCNPLLIQQTISGSHMDVIVLPFVLAALGLAARHRFIVAVIPLAVAVAAKIWPILLLPLILRPLLGPRWRNGFIAAAIFIFLAAAMLWPQFAATQTGRSETGTVAYTMHWFNNSAIFFTLTGIFLPIVKLLYDPELSYRAELWARFTLAALVIAWTLWMSRRAWSEPHALFTRATWVIAALFLFSPTQFPWYYIWLLPLLALCPVWPLLIYTPLLALYPLHYHWAPVVWIEHAPVWICLIACAWTRRNHNRPQPAR